MGTWVLSRSQINLCTSLGLVPETTWPANRVVKIGTKGAKPFYLWTRGGVYVELRTLVNRWASRWVWRGLSGFVRASPACVLFDIRRNSLILPLFLEHSKRCFVGDCDQNYDHYITR